MTASGTTNENNNRAILNFKMKQKGNLVPEEFIHFRCNI